MPELPEVETTRRGIEPHISGQILADVILRKRQLRWPIPDDIAQLKGHRIDQVKRRGKYLLLSCSKSSRHRGTIIVHLGMSGSLRVCTPDMPLRKHDHVEFSLTTGNALRFHDPRRFGCVLWSASDPHQHPLLAKLGPEPLSDDFNGEHLFCLSRKRKINVKTFIMDSHTVVGVGNIYASESLFSSSLRPGRAASRISRKDYDVLANNIKDVLDKAIKMGGTTLRDFVNSDGEPGYFAQQLLVYGRSGEPCRSCKTPIKNKVIAQRSSFYCPSCQN